MNSELKTSDELRDIVVNGAKKALNVPPTVQDLLESRSEAVARHARCIVALMDYLYDVSLGSGIHPKAESSQWVFYNEEVFFGESFFKEVVFPECRRIAKKYHVELVYRYDEKSYCLFSVNSFIEFGALSDDEMQALYHYMQLHSVMSKSVEMAMEHIVTDPRGKP